MISAVINTLNEEKNIKRVISSLKGFVNEIVVVDMESDDKTQDLAKEEGAKVFVHKRVGYVEPARNFAIQKAKGDWILIVDADEEVPASLGRKLKEIEKRAKGFIYKIPRKNIIFGKWIKYGGWWPDYNVRFFKKGSVTWSDKIHSVPFLKGRVKRLKAREDLAIVHHNYQTISQFIQRLDRYTTIQAKEKREERKRLTWKDVVRRPTEEFIRRFFFYEGYKDGLHGLSLALLQAFSELVVYLKLWESEDFLRQQIDIRDFSKEAKRLGFEVRWWIVDSLSKNAFFLDRFYCRLVKKIIEWKRR